MITVPLNPKEKDALLTLAERERRGPREQAAVIIRRELERAGLLPEEKPGKAPAELGVSNGYAK